MSNQIWGIIGVIGVIAIGGLAYYSFSRDRKDPFGVLEDIWNDNFVEGGKFIVPRSLRTEGGGILPRNLDKVDVTKGLKFDRPVDKLVGT